MNKGILLLSACLVASMIPANARRHKDNVEKTVTTTTTVVRGDTTITTTTVTTTPAPVEEQPQKRSFKSRLSLGGYGEATYTHNFYSDNVNRYSKAEDYKDSKGHSRFDLPHAVIMLGFDFGRGWTFGSEIEFEHGGTESAVEMEAEETGEWENEIERGGEVALEQLWINKEFRPWLQVRAGHMVVPVGSLNSNHLPNEFFTVFRPEGEATILPSTWHQTGLSIWGQHKWLRYEVMALPALNSCFFSKDAWVHYGATSPFEFTQGNNIAVAARLDFIPVQGLRLSASGYYGNSFNNTLQSDFNGKYKDVKGAVAIGSFDMEYKGYGFIVRGNATYGHLGDADKISDYNRLQMKTSPYKRTLVGKEAYSYGIEAGYNILRPIQSVKYDKLYVFGRYEAYDAYKPANGAYRDYPWTEVKRMAVGLNYLPMKQIVIKAEYSRRFLKSQYNDEPSISIGVTYTGNFL